MSTKLYYVLVTDDKDDDCSAIVEATGPGAAYGQWVAWYETFAGTLDKTVLERPIIYEIPALTGSNRFFQWGEEIKECSLS